MPTSFTDDLRLAHVLADDADSLSTNRYQALDLRVDTKPDLSPVTDADRAVEEGIRRTLGRARPRDAILGEEQGSTGFSQRRWVVDPIDGTKNFVRGVPVWATLISLMVEDEVVVGVVSAPQLNRRWWAMKDGGAFTGRSLLKPLPIRVSDVSRLEDASFSYSSLDGWDHAGRLDDFLALSRHSWRTRAYGDFWSHMLVAEGAVDFAAEPELELYDMAALDVIVREAGGRFTSLDGRDGPHGGNALASNGILHETVLGFLGSVGPDARPSADGRPAGAAGGDDERASDHPEGSEAHGTGDRAPAREGSVAPREPGGTLHQLSDRRRPAPTGQGPDLPPM
ncbi:histidinol phosphatase [Nocardioides sp. HDW12B]|uniref:inositol monophosphatase family protein n=1 Tax=Nocardioides sp. HDW12B TaxID=2714939 RepID=UPI00140AA4B2|nr:histidinol phosphatase [Nocardioides sp. HDW12B]